MKYIVHVLMQAPLDSVAFNSPLHTIEDGLAPASKIADNGHETSTFKKMPTQSSEEPVDSLTDIKTETGEEKATAAEGNVPNDDDTKKSSSDPPNSTPMSDAALEALIKEQSEHQKGKHYDSWYVDVVGKRMNSAAIYEAYLKKLEAEDKALEDHKSASKHKIRGEQEYSSQFSRSSKLVRGFVDYVRVLEQRIENLESSANVGTSKTEYGEVATVEVPAEVELTVKFYHAAKEIDAVGNFRAKYNITNNTFNCRNDRQQILRVLFDWVDGAPKDHPKDLNSSSLLPEYIEIQALGITSEPISKFLDHKLGAKSKSGLPLTRLFRPFRPLLRNFSALKEQLLKLKAKYG
jgi:hypothetical protein